jgi:hypothetical protein
MTKKQRAAVKKMQAGQRRWQAGKARKKSRPAKRRRRAARRRKTTAAAPAVQTNPRRKSMARKRRRRAHGGGGKRRRRARRRATAVLINPRRKRRRNPGFSIGAGVKDMTRVLLPAAAGGLAMGFIDSKFLGDTSIIVRLGAKLALTVGAAMLLRKKPSAAYAAMGAILGSGTYDVGVRAAGGVIAASKAQGMKELAALAAEDGQSMGLLQREMQGMGLLLTGMEGLEEIQPNLGEAADDIMPNLGDDDGTEYVDQAMEADFG